MTQFVLNNTPLIYLQSAMYRVMLKCIDTTCSDQYIEKHLSIRVQGASFKVLKATILLEQTFIDTIKEVS